MHYHVSYSGSTITAVEADIVLGPVNTDESTVEYLIDWRRVKATIACNTNRINSKVSYLQTLNKDLAILDTFMECQFYLHLSSPICTYLFLLSL